MLKSHRIHSAREVDIRTFPTGWTALLVLALVGVPAAQAFGRKPQTVTVNASTVEAQVRKFGIGKDVKIKLTGGAKLRGHITSISENSFTVTLRKGQLERRIPYSDVAMIKDPGPVFWILVGAAVVVIIIVAVH
jgi:sRNA-binding regulator protein Hfq